MPTLVPTTLGEMRADVQDWLGGEKVSDSRINSAISDAIESFWMEAILAVLNIFMGGPVNITIPSGAERVQITTIPDPTTPASLTFPVSGALASHTGNVVYTLVTESGSETLPSPAEAYSCAGNQVVSTTSPAWVQGAMGWNCYATSSLNPTTDYAKQNTDPIAFGTAFQEPDLGFITAPNDAPEVPIENTTGDNIAFIQHLEFKTSSGMYQPYNAGDVDSLLMRRMASIVATSSEYQNYAWDLINQRQLEIRPAAGTTFIPRYFFIAKPRRLMFDGSPLPFPNVPTTKYFRTQSLADIFLSLHEYPAAAAWEAKAEMEMRKAVRSVSRINTNRNVYVTPFLR